MNSSTPSSSASPWGDPDTFITSVLGPERLPLNWLIPLTSVYVVIFITGMVGNTCTCLVIGRNPYMQTATNCYLFNLAIADMLTLLCAMPLELYTLWHQYPWQLGIVVCELKALVPEATAYASILTIVTFSTERYIAICHPIRLQTKSKLSRALRNIVIIWILSLVGATPYGIFTRVNYLTGEKGVFLKQSAWCGFPFNDPDRSWETLILCSTFLFFVAPMTAITALYVRIAVTLHQSRQLQRTPTEGPEAPRTHAARTESERHKAQSRRIVVRMLIAVVVAFFVCWAPFHAQRLLFLYVSLYGEWTDRLRKVNQDLFSLAGCFYYFNSTINPILYSVMSNRFRVAFREKLCTGRPMRLCCCLEPPEELNKRAYRNSHSHSSVRSQQASYPLTNLHTLPKTHSCPRLLRVGGAVSGSVGAVQEARMEHSDSFSPGMTWVRNPHYLTVHIQDRGSGTLTPGHASSEPNFGRTLLRGSPDPEPIPMVTAVAANGEATGVSKELDMALGPELARLQSQEPEADCVDCTNCQRLFPAHRNFQRAGSPQEYTPVHSESSNTRAYTATTSV